VDDRGGVGRCARRVSRVLSLDDGHDGLLPVACLNPRGPMGRTHPGDHRRPFGLPPTRARLAGTAGGRPAQTLTTVFSPR
jgi:hypothetical protein